MELATTGLRDINILVDKLFIIKSVEIIDFIYVNVFNY